jgi:preprotein translocase subunit SecB
VTIDPARQTAARLAAKADLLDIRAVRIEASLHTAFTEPPYDVNVIISPSYDIQRDEDEDGWLVVYSFGYEIPVTADATQVFDLACTYNAAYGLRVTEPPTDDELVAFGETTVALALYPYVRQLVHDTSGRFNMPPLVMPVYRQPISIERPKPKKAVAKKGTAK